MVERSWRQSVTVPVTGMTCASCTNRIVSLLRWVAAPELLRPIFGEYGLLNPILAAAAMAFSSVSVLANSLRLRRLRVR